MQIGQLATELKSRPRELLPSDIKQPKKGWKEQYKALTLRSGRVVPLVHQQEEDNNEGTISNEISKGEGEVTHKDEPVSATSRCRTEQTGEKKDSGTQTT